MYKQNVALTWKIRKQNKQKKNISPIYSLSLSSNVTNFTPFLFVLSLSLSLSSLSLSPSLFDSSICRPLKNETSNSPT